MSVAGTWNIEINTPMGQQHGRLELSQAADGTWQGTSQDVESGEESALTDITVEGNDVTWHQVVTKPMVLNVECSVTIDGDTLSGKAKAGMFPAVNMTGERAS
jgi:hypothetical protein